MPEFAPTPGDSDPLAIQVRATSSGVQIDHGGLLSEDQASWIASAIIESQPGVGLQRWTENIHRLDIWGPTFRMFMGMSDAGGGVDEIQDNPASWGRARIAEPYVYRAQSVRSDAISSVPLKCWIVDRNGRRTATPHVSVDILNRAVPLDPGWDPYVSGLDGLLCYTMLALDNIGRSAWQITGWSFPQSNGRRIPTELTWTVPTAFNPVHGFERDLNVPFAGINYLSGGTSKFIPADQLVYFTTPNPNDPILGTSKISVLRNAINLRLYSVKSNYDFFKNSMRPDWILSGDWKNSEQNIETIKRSLRRHYTGESNREPLVLGEGAKAALLTTTQKDAEWTSMMRMVGEEIMAIYGVPVLYLNNFERATYENAKQARLMLWHDCLIAETRRLAAQITRRYLWRFWPETRGQNMELAFDYGAVEGLTEDVGLLWERVNNFQEKLQKQVEGGMMTANQARMVMVQIVELMGLDATPWKSNLPTGDIRFVPYNVIPSDQSSVQALMNAEASRSANPLTAFLIENVPGAPNAGDNARKGDAVLDSRAQRDQQAQAAQRPSTASLKSEIAEIKTLLSHQTATRVLKALPNPLTVRDARLDPIQKRMIAKLKVFFQGQQSTALRNLRKNAKAFDKKADSPDPDTLWDREQAKAEIRAVIRAGGGESAEQAFQAASNEFGLSGVVWEDDMPWLESYMGGRLDLIDGIDDTTVDALRETLLEGGQAGDSIPQLADRVSEVFRQAIDHRAELIARTETIQAYGNASLEAYRRAGIEKARMYDGPNADSADCINVDGQVVSLAEAQTLMNAEHPNGTRGVAPVVEVDAPLATVAALPAPRPMRIEVMPGVFVA